MRSIRKIEHPRRFTDEQIARIREENRVTPVWLLFYLRELRSCDEDYLEAWKRLPRVLPCGLSAPSIVECVTVLAINRLI